MWLKWTAKLEMDRQVSIIAFESGGDSFVAALPCRSDVHRFDAKATKKSKATKI